MLSEVDAEPAINLIIFRNMRIFTPHSRTQKFLQLFKNAKIATSAVNNNYALPYFFIN